MSRKRFMAAIAVVCLAGGAVFGIAGPALADNTPVASAPTSAAADTTAAATPTDPQPAPVVETPAPVVDAPAPVVDDPAPAPADPVAVVPQPPKESTPAEPDTSTKTDPTVESCHNSDTNRDAKDRTSHGNWCEQSLVATASVSFIDATCSAAERLVLGEVVNAIWGAVTDPPGPDDYRVTAIANEGAEFAGGHTKLTFHGKLDPIEHGRHCDATTHTKVTFCHATGGETNPYVEIHTTVKTFFRAGHDGHQRDIVPPFSYLKHGHTINFPGLNWDADGQAIFENGCKEVIVPSVATASVSFTDATCTVAEQLVLGEVVNATWGEVSDPEGSDSYTVTATANSGAQFTGGLVALTFHGVLNPIDKGPNCDNTTSTYVDFCHATGGEGSGYTRIETSVAVFFQDGHDTHQNFGDIVPPFSYLEHGVSRQFPGLNWGADGQAFFENGCKDMTVPSVATASVSFTDATCAAGASVVLGDVANATWGEITDPEGPDDYTVTATANTGAQFAGGLSQLTFHGELDGILDPLDPQCQLPTEALVLPVVTFTQITCDSDGTMILGVATGYDPTHVTFTVNGVSGISSGTYAVTKAGTTTVTAQAVSPNGLEPRWVTPPAFTFDVPSEVDCGVVTTTESPRSRLAFTGVSDPSTALALGGLLLFLGITARHLGRRRHTIR